MNTNDPRRWRPAVDVQQVRVLLRSLSAICDGVAAGLEPEVAPLPARLPAHDRDEYPCRVARAAFEAQARRRAT
jgi:hypothetical protein